MVSAKNIRVAPIKANDAAKLVKRVHYSGKVVNNSQLHFGVFLGDVLEGVMQYGPSLDKRKIQGLVAGTLWNDFIELNRMAFSDKLPRNSESRALSISFKMIKKHYPNIKWVITFADATQCGDGTIYRAAGFKLIGIKKNNQIWQSPSGDKFSRMPLADGKSKSKSEQRKARVIASRTTLTKGKNILENGAASMKAYKNAGWSPLQGFQLKYIYFLDKTSEKNLNVPIIPFSKIEDIGAGMYRGDKISRAKKQDFESPSELGGALPTRTLHNKANNK